MPLKSDSTSWQPGSPFDEQFPTVGVPLGSAPPLPPPPERTRPSTMPMIASTTTPPTAARTFGSACRRRGMPFDWTGGGAAAAARRICLLFLPLGICGKGSGGFLGIRRCQAQENREEDERREREGRDRHVAEVVDPLHAAVGGADRAGGRL